MTDHAEEAAEQEARAVRKLRRQNAHKDQEIEKMRRRIVELEALTDSETTTMVPMKGMPSPAELHAMSQSGLVDYTLRLQRKVQALNKRVQQAEAGKKKKKK